MGGKTGIVLKIHHNLLEIYADRLAIRLAIYRK